MTESKPVYVQVRTRHGVTTLYGPFENPFEAERLAQRFTEQHRHGTGSAAKTVRAPRSATAFRAAIYGISQ